MLGQFSPSINLLPSHSLLDSYLVSPMSPPKENTMLYVRLGKSGLKVSRLILYAFTLAPPLRGRLRWRRRGCLSYGSPEHQAWILGEKEGTTSPRFSVSGYSAPFYQDF